MKNCRVRYERVCANLNSCKRLWTIFLEQKAIMVVRDFQMTAVPALNTSLISDTLRVAEPPPLIRNLESNDADEIIVTSPAFPRGVTFKRLPFLCRGTFLSCLRGYTSVHPCVSPTQCTRSLILAIWSSALNSDWERTG